MKSCESANEGSTGVVEAAQARVWAAMRALVESHPTNDLLRAALDLGRGSGRSKALLLLAERPLSLSGLADAMGIDAPYATVIVDSLEGRSLVERQPDPPTAAASSSRSPTRGTRRSSDWSGFSGNPRQGSHG